VINSDSTPRLVSFHEDLAPSPRAAERPLSIIECLAAQTLGDRLQVGVAQAAGYVRSRVMTWSRRAVVNVIGAMGASPGSDRNTVLIDYVTESPNVSGDDRSVMLLPDPIGLAAPVEEPT
jgi:hypothetical protein